MLFEESHFNPQTSKYVLVINILGNLKNETPSKISIKDLLLISTFAVETFSPFSFFTEYLLESEAEIQLAFLKKYFFIVCWGFPSTYLNS